MACVKFKYQDECFVYQKLIDAVNILCAAKGKNCTCTSGYRSIEKQKIINAQVLAQSKSNYQKPNGAVYNSKGQCLAAAYGSSNHCYCFAMDIDDAWFKALTNVELKKFQLVKPMDYEPWHVQLLEHKSLSQKQKEQIRDSVLKGKVDDDITKNTSNITTYEQAMKVISEKVNTPYSYWINKKPNIDPAVGALLIKIANSLRLYKG